MAAAVAVVETVVVMVEPEALMAGRALRRCAIRCMRSLTKSHLSK